ncbi:hypothetical protein [uncultured Campylobacter sp.]|uniref:hypothetical protein n=1 Tax=uncultured Campylobacter sp. TaxID=218934 RepID=UPI002636E15A|nr:hypothetical protein [uncultured Campylobacter sp.]
MNEAKPKELKKILNERRQNLEQGSEGNCDAQNFDALNFDLSKFDTLNLSASNFDASDLNNTNSKVLNFNNENVDDLNLNAECGRRFQNLDSDDVASNKNSKTGARDYDKEPLVIKNYEKFFVYARLFIILPVSGLPLLLIRDIIDFGYIDTYEYLLSCIALLLIAVITYIFTAIRNKREIKFTNQYIEFLDKGVVKRQCKVEEEALRRNFSTENFRASSFIVLVVLCAGSLGLFLVALIFMYIINMLLKLIVYFYINRSLKGFKIFPFIKVARPGYGKYLYNAVAIAAHYYLIYLYSSEIYDEVREYFLQKNINIDYIKKDYTVFI